MFAKKFDIRYLGLKFIAPLFFSRFSRRPFPLLIYLRSYEEDLFGEAMKKKQDRLGGLEDYFRAKGEGTGWNRIVDCS